MAGRSVAPRKFARARSTPSRRRRTQLGVAIAALLGAAVILALAIGGRGGSGDSGTSARTLSEGAMAPRVDLASTTGAQVDITAFRGKRNVLLYFYEHAG